jgi:superfamily II DNA/RNA helicase
LVARDQDQGLSTKHSAIILEPTRELARQVQTQINKFTDLKSVLLTGGFSDRSEQCKFSANSNLIFCSVRDIKM